MIFMKSNYKKGNLSVTIFVLLVILVCGVSIFYFLTSNSKIGVHLGNSRIQDMTYLYENQIYSFLEEVGKQAFYESYDKFAKEGFYASPVIHREGNLKFYSLDEELNEKFLKEFKDNLENKIISIEFKEYPLKNFSEFFLKETKTSSGKIFNINGDFLTLEINDFEIFYSSEKINISYFPSLSVKIDYESNNLKSFEEIYEVKQKCKIYESSKEIKECFEQMGDFEILVSEKGEGDEKYFLIKFVSKDRFFILDKYTKIELEFVLA
jgi:hypothetical protein